MENDVMKNRWVDDVMDSAKGISRAQPEVDLYRQITVRINNPEQATVVSFPVKQWIAAAILLLALNISSAVYFTTKSSKVMASSNLNPLAAEMQVESTYNY